MSLRWYTVVVDSHDVLMLSHWWAETLGWEIEHESDRQVVVLPPHAAEGPVASADWTQEPPGLVFVPVEDGRTAKNHLHLDLAPHVSQDRDAEIRGLLDRGATLADVGQDPGAAWTVLRDPEGNEFCVLSTRDE